MYKKHSKRCNFNKWCVGCEESRKKTLNQNPMSQEPNKECCVKCRTSKYINISGKETGAPGYVIVDKNTKNCNCVCHQQPKEECKTKFFDNCIKEHIKKIWEKSSDWKFEKEPQVKEEWESEFEKKFMRSDGFVDCQWGIGDLEQFIKDLLQTERENFKKEILEKITKYFNEYDPEYYDLKDIIKFINK